MGSKISNIIAVELAILIGIMSWMAYFLFAHLSVTHRTMAEIRGRNADRVASVDAARSSQNRRPYVIHYRSGRERAPSASEITQDDEDVRTEPDSAPGLEDTSLVQTSEPYVQSSQVRSVVEPAYLMPAQTVAYQQPAEAVVYQEPTGTAAYEEPVVYQEPAQIYYQEPAYFVAYSNPYRFANRFRSKPRRCAFVRATHPSSDRMGSHQQNRCEPVPQQQNVANVSGAETRENVAWIESRRNHNVSSGHPTQGFRREGIVRQSSGSQRFRSRN